MSEERHYIVESLEGFDGATFVAITEPWLPGLPQNTHQKLRSVVLADGTNAGRFSPQVLGRPAKGISLVRVWTDGPLADGDSYSSVGAATSIAADGILRAFPTSVNRGVTVPLGLGPRAAKAIELGPTDDLVITKSNGSGSPVTVHIVVLDLTEEETFSWTEFNNTVIDSLETTETRRITVTAGPVDILPWAVNRLYVEAFATSAGGSLRLPSLATQPVGSRIRIHRLDISGVGGTHFFLIASGVETINGMTNPIPFAYNGFGVYLDATADGWLASSAPRDETAIAQAGTALIAVTSRERQLIEWTPGTDTTLTLPPAATMAINQEIEVVVVNTTGSGGTVIPTAGEQVDRVINKPTPLVRAGDSAIFRRIPTGAWLSYLNYNPLNRDSFAVAADPALGASTGWDGNRHYRATYAAPGNFTLPTAPKLGTEITISQSNANAVTLQAGGNVIIAGGTAIATLALTINAPIHLVFFTGAWVQV